jgi:hypothetical protein
LWWLDPDQALYETIFGYGFYEQKLKWHLSSLKTPNKRIKGFTHIFLEL